MQIHDRGHTDKIIIMLVVVLGIFQGCEIYADYPDEDQDQDDYASGWDLGDEKAC